MSRAEVLADSPSGYWHLDESSGTSLNDEISTNDGVANGSPTMGKPPLTPDEVGTSILLVSSSSQYLTFPGNQITVDGTLELWFRWFEGTTSLLRDATSTGGRLVADVGGRFVVRWVGAGDIDCGPIGIARDGRRHHLVITKDDANIVVYLDNEVVGTSSTATNASSSGSWFLGKNGNAAGHTTCIVDEFAVYQTPLTPSRVTAHFDEAVLGPEYFTLGTKSETGAGVPVITTTTDVTAGESILVLVAYDSSSRSVSSITDSVGNTYTQDDFEQHSSAPRRVEVWSCHNCIALPASSSITVTPDSATSFNKMVGALAVYGLDGTPLDKTSGGQGTGTVWSTGSSGTLAQPLEFTLAVALAGSATANVPGEPESIELYDLSMGTRRFVVVTNPTYTTDAVSFSGTVGSGSWAANLVTYKLAAAGGTLHEGGGDLDATSGLSGKAGATKTGGGDVSGSGSVAGAASAIVGGAGDLSGASDLSGAAASTLTSGGSVSASSDLAGTANILAVGGGDLEGNSNVVGAAGVLATAGGELSGSSTLTGAADVLVVQYGGGMLSASSDLIGAGSLVRGAGGSLLATGSMTGRATAIFVSSGLLSAESSLVGAGTVPRFGKPTTGYIEESRGHLAGPSTGRIDRPTTGGFS